MNKKYTTYTEAADRLEEIVQYIDNQSPSIDELIKLVAEAVQLTKYCKEKLTETDKKLAELINQLDSN